MIPSRHRRAFRTIFCTAAAVLSLTATAAAAGPRWRQATPFGGPLVALAEAPSAPQVLYAGALTGRIFHSGDGGATWQARAVLSGQAEALVVDLLDPQTVFAETQDSRLQRTRDGGLTWSAIGPFPFSGGALALDRSHPGALVAATGGGLYRSPDRGETWEILAFSGLPVAAVAFDPQAGSTLFAAIGVRQLNEPFTVWRSTDGGASWTESGLSVTQDLDGGIPRFVFDPAHAGTVYALFAAYLQLAPIFRSTDGGASWTELTAALGLEDVLAADGELLGASFSGGFARSGDRGDSWVPALPGGEVLTGPRDFLARLTASVTPGRILAIGARGFWASGDGGVTWTDSNQGLLAQGALSIGASPLEPSALLAVAGSSIFRSMDQGATWQRTHSELDGGPQPVAIEAFHPLDPEKVYGTGFDGQATFLVESSDSGGTWSMLPLPYGCAGSNLCSVDMPVITVDPRAPDAVFVGGFYFRQHGGSGDFLVRSDDGFSTWTDLHPLRRLGSLVVDAEKANSLYGLTCAGLYHSGDAGKTWQKTGRGLPKAICPQAVARPLLLRDPRQPRTFYAGTATQGVFVSTDGGATFRAMNNGLATAAIAALLIDPENSSRLFVSVAGQGVFRWNRKNNRWTPLNQGLPLQGFLGAVVLDPQHPSVLYAASPSQGIFRLDLDATEP